MSKRGKIELKEILEVLLAIAGVFLLTILIIRIFSPSLSFPEQTAKSYLESLERSLDEAKKYGSSEFMMYSSEPNPYFLVYFGEGYSFEKEIGEWTFKPKEAKKNNFCICHFSSEKQIKNIYRKDLEVYCNHCVQVGIKDDTLQKYSQNLPFQFSVNYDSANSFFYIHSGNTIYFTYLSDLKMYEISIRPLNNNEILLSYNSQSLTEEEFNELVDEGIIDKGEANAIKFASTLSFPEGEDLEELKRQITENNENGEVPENEN